MTKRRHNFDGKELAVTIYRKNLGLIPPDFDTTKPFVPLPNPLIISGIRKSIREYLDTLRAAREDMEEKLRPQHASVDWKHPEITELRILCSLDTDMLDIQYLIENWNQNVQEIIRETLGKYVSKQISSLQKTYPKLKKYVDSLANTPNKANMICIFPDVGNCEFVVVGPAEGVDTIVESIETKHRAIENTVARVKEEICVSKGTLFVLIQMDFFTDLASRLTNLDITPDHIQSKITLDGNPSEIQNAKKLIVDQLATISSRRMRVKPAIARVLKSENGSEYVNHEMKKSGLSVYVEPLQTEVIIYAKALQLADAERVINIEVPYKDHTLTEEEKPAVQTENWAQFTTAIQQKYQDRVWIDLPKNFLNVVVAACRREFDSALNDMENFLKTNASGHKFVSMDKAYVKIISTHLKMDLEHSMKLLAQWNMKVSSQLASHRTPGFLLEGAEEGLTEAASKLQTLANRISLGEYRVDTPGMPAFFKDERGIQRVESLEHEHRVVIELLDEYAIEKREKAPKKKKEEMMVSRIDPSGTVIKVFKGDITEHNVEVIVNAANSDLNHSGGLAEAIIKKGQSQC